MQRKIVKNESIPFEFISKGIARATENKIADKKGDSSFVVISSYKQSPLNGQRRWHCLPIVNVDKVKKQLQIINKRTDEVITLNFEEFIDNFKAIVGIFHT